MSLHFAIRILLSTDLYMKYLQYAQSLLEYFTKQFIVFYGAEYISHNVHGLVHIVEDCKLFGNLDLYSAFPFKNYLQHLKRLVRKSDVPLAQILNRIHESQNLLVTASSKKVELQMAQEHHEGSLPAENFSGQYKKLIINNILFTTRFGDNCCHLKDKSIVLIENFATKGNNNYLIGKKFINVTDFISEPFQSSNLDIYSVHTVGELSMWPVQDISKKFVILPYNNINVVFPLIHTC